MMVIGLIILSALGVGALIAVSLVNRRQAMARRTRQKMKMLKYRVDGIEELTVTLDQVVETREIVRRVYRDAINILNYMSDLDPQAGFLQASVQHAQKLAEDLNDDYGRQLSRMKETDAQIARTQQALTEAARILRQQSAKGEINPADLSLYLIELNWVHLMVEVCSLVGRGLRAMGKDDTLGAFAFYKRAQTCLLQSEHKDPRRQQLIKELNEMQGKTRVIPSHNLMPEAAAFANARNKAEDLDIDLNDQSKDSDTSQESPAANG